MSVTSKKRVGLRSPLQPAINTAESWQDGRRNRIVQRFGRFHMRADASAISPGEIHQTLFGLRQHLIGTCNSSNLIVQMFFPIRQSAKGAMEAFGASSMRFQKIIITPHGYVSAQGPANTLLKKISFPRMDGVVGGALMIGTVMLAQFRQRVDAFTDVTAVSAMMFKRINNTPDYNPVGGMGSITVTPRADNSIVQSLQRLRISAQGALMLNFGTIASTLPAMRTRADAYTNVFSSSAMSLRFFGVNKDKLLITGNFSFFNSGSIDAFTLKNFFIRADVLVVNDGAIQMRLPSVITQHVVGWGSAVGSASTLLFRITESGNLAPVVNGTITQSFLGGITISGLMGAPTFMAGVQTLFPISQHVIGNLPTYGAITQSLFRLTQHAGGTVSSTFNLTWDLTAQTNLAKGERGLNIAGRGISDVLIGLALQGTFG